MCILYKHLCNILCILCKSVCSVVCIWCKCLSTIGCIWYKHLCTIVCILCKGLYQGDFLQISAPQYVVLQISAPQCAFCAKVSASFFFANHHIVHFMQRSVDYSVHFLHHLHTDVRNWETCGCHSHVSVVILPCLQVGLAVGKTTISVEQESLVVKRLVYFPLDI